MGMGGQEVEQLIAQTDEDVRTGVKQRSVQRVVLAHLQSLCAHEHLVLHSRAEIRRALDDATHCTAVIDGDRFGAHDQRGRIADVGRGVGARHAELLPADRLDLCSPVGLRHHARGDEVRLADEVRDEA